MGLKEVNVKITLPKSSLLARSIPPPSLGGVAPKESGGGVELRQITTTTTPKPTQPAPPEPHETTTQSASPANPSPEMHGESVS